MDKMMNGLMDGWWVDGWVRGCMVILEPQLRQSLRKIKKTGPPLGYN